MARRAKPLFVRYCAADFLSGVITLSPMAELAYRRICDMIYNSNDQLILDDRKLASATKTGRSWPSVKRELLDEQKITIENGRIRVQRCTHELAVTSQLLAQRKAASQIAAEKRKSLKDKDASASSDIPTDPPKRDRPTHRNASKPGNYIYKERLPNGSLKKEDPSLDLGIDDDKPKKRRGTRLGEDWKPSEKDVEFARSKNFSDERIKELAFKFVAYWTNGKGKNQAHISWSKTWQVWIINETRFSLPDMRQGGGQRTSNPSPHNKMLAGAIPKETDAN